MDLWLSMAGPELPNSSLTDFHYCTMNEIHLLCSALCHVGAVWRAAGCGCLQLQTKEQRDPNSLWEGAPSLCVENPGVTTQCTGALSPVLHTCLLASPVPFAAFLSLQCWDCCGLLREWGDQRRHPPADVLAAPRQPHRGRRAGQGEHPQTASLSTSPPGSGCAWVSFLFSLRIWAQSCAKISISGGVISSALLKITKRTRRVE